MAVACRPLARNEAMRGSSWTAGASQGDSDPEGGAVSGPVHDAGFPAVGSGYAADDAEAQSCCPGGRGSGAEWLEDELFLAGRQPATVVGHLEPPGRRLGVDPKADWAVSVRMPGRVLQQVQ